MGGDTLSEETEPSEPARSGGHPVLRADCERCFGLCCVVPAVLSLGRFRDRQARGASLSPSAARFPVWHSPRAQAARFPGVRRV